TCSSYHRRSAGDRNNLSIYPDSPSLLINPPVNPRGAGSHGYGLTHASRTRGRVLTLVIPLGAFGDLVVLEFIHGGVADLALNDTETQRLNDNLDLAVPRALFAA